MKKFACMLAAAFLLAAPIAVQATTLEEAHALANDCIAGKLPYDDTLAKLAAIGADTSNDARVRCVALARRASVLYNAGHVEEAIPDVEAAVKLNPKSGTAFWMYGLIDAAQKKFKDGADKMATAVANAKEDPSTDAETVQRYENLQSMMTLAAEAPDAAAFQKEFQENVFAAEEKWQGKSFYLKGKVEKIGRTMFDEKPEITLNGGGPFLEVDVELPKDSASDVAKLKKGQNVMLWVTLKKGGEAITHMTGELAPKEWY